ncbi:MAG: hypothetical protein GY856_18860, partial [bacterium]|nr:hypothetical protein [bacterium]
MAGQKVTVKTGWSSWITKFSLAVLLFEAVTGLVVTLAPFHPIVQWNVLVHALVGVVTLLPIAWYLAVHWDDYRRFSLSDVVLLGYVAVVALGVCVLSGLVVTWQGLFAIRMSPVWRNVHLISTLVALGASLPHLALSYWRVRRKETSPVAGPVLVKVLVATLVGVILTGALTFAYSERPYVNELPEDYRYVYGPDRPFAPSLARTSTGGAFDAESLAGSESCGSAGCHSQILEEWKPSTHRYAAQDVLFQGVQKVMAEQNGPESTRYCGG